MFVIFQRPRDFRLNLFNILPFTPNRMGLHFGKNLP